MHHSLDPSTASRVALARAFLCALALTHAPGSAAIPKTHDTNRFLFGYEAQGYRSGITPNPFQILTGGAELHHESNDALSEVNLRLSVNPENPKVWALRGSDAFVTWNRAGSLRFTLGRKDRIWNELDSSWNLSFVQPIDQWDRFRPAQQGLLGAFLECDAGPLVFHLFGSYLTLPENIPNVVIENGSFVSWHPQAISSTPQTISLLNQSAPVFYEIEYPRTADVLFRPSLLASIETPVNSPLLLRLMYGWKPYNYFTYALRGGLSIPNVQVQIQIQPRLNLHQVLGGDLGFRMPATPFSLGMSALVDQPGPETLAPGSTYAPVSTATLLSPWISWETAAFGVRASQLLWYGGTEADVGPFSNPGASVISSHVFYRNATQVTAHFDLPMPSTRIRLEGKWIHEYEISADLLGGDVMVPLQTGLGEMRFFAGGDMVQTALDANPNRGSELLIDLRTLDRVRLGVTLAL